MKMLEGKVAVVTGSASGIGASSVLKLAELGANVVVNYSRSADEAKEVGQSCLKKGAEVEVVQADVSRDDDCRRLVEAAEARWGRVDILVNNAGTTKFADHSNLEELDAEDFQSIYATNVIGAYQMTRAVADLMKDQYEEGIGERGSVINISSIAGVSGIGSSIAYAASKGAFNTMTLSLARSQAPFMRVNAVCPGFVGTRWFRDRFGEEGFAKLVERIEAATPLDHAGMGEDVADVVAFFASPWSRHVTGETLLVDGGSHLDMTPLVAR